MQRFLTGYATTLLALATIIRLWGGHANTWLHPLLGSLLFLGIMPCCILLSIWTRAQLRRAWSDAGSTAMPASAPTSIRIWATFEYAFFACSLVALLTGLIITCAYLSYEPAILGAKLGATLVTPFYGVLLALGARVLRLRIERGLGPTA